MGIAARTQAKVKADAIAKADAAEKRKFDADKKFIARETGTAYAEEAQGDWTYHHKPPQTVDVTAGRLPFYDPAGSATNNSGRGRVFCASCACRMTPFQTKGASGRVFYYQCIQCGKRGMIPAR